MNSLQKKAYNWLTAWTWKKGRIPDPSREIIVYFSPYKPKTKVLLYRAERYGYDISRATNPTYVSFTHQKGFAEFMVESRKQQGKRYRIIKRTIYPRDILVDVTKLPFAEDFVDEVIVKRTVL